MDTQPSKLNEAAVSPAGPETKESMPLLSRSASSRPNLDLLIRNVALRFSKFLMECWESDPRVLPSNPGGADGASDSLLPWGDMMGVLRAAQAPTRPLEVEVLVFKDSCPTTEYPSCHAAYLDGCSIVVNHIDKVYEPVYSVCSKLRSDIPHMFTNMYLTPPDEQAVAPHADDRDVLVLQIAGSKTWKVYSNPPVPFPYPSEQVGKSDAYPVPAATLEAEPLINTVLRAGDVLYMPRGFVHEALTSDEASLHLTFALPTHDWSWASVITDALRSSGRCPEECAKFQAGVLEREDCGSARATWFWRRSVPPALICSGWAATPCEAALREAAAVAVEVGLDGAAAVRASFGAKAAHHNKRQDDIVASMMSAVGLTLAPSSHVRRLTKQEKELSQKLPQYLQQGIMARAELQSVIPKILGNIAEEPVCISAFEDCQTLCAFGKVCFAGVCVDQALLCVCDASGKKLDGIFTSASKPPKKLQGKTLKKRRVKAGITGGESAKRRSVETNQDNS